jgi:hypothetical protein
MIPSIVQYLIYIMTLRRQVLSNHMMDVNGAEDIINQLKARQPRIVLLLLKAKEMPGWTSSCAVIFKTTFL